MATHNLFYAQSGGVTPVINATACGVIQAARRSRKIGKIYAGKNGILGALYEELIDVAQESPTAIAALRHTPGGAFGSCRHKLSDPQQQPVEFDRLLQVFAMHDIRYFLYNGGGDSQDTTMKIAEYSEARGYPLCCVGIPKTIDNDLPITDNSPGFASVAKYIAVSVMEAGLDVASMCASSTKVFILEVMGRHSGWIAAAAGLAATRPGDPPQLILFPEIPFVQSSFLARVKTSVERYGYCVIVASEGVRDRNGDFVAAAANRRDAFGHHQLGGVAPYLAEMVQEVLGYKYHWAVSDYLQRAARHVASAVDVKQAEAVGAKAVELALQGKNAHMPIIVRGRGKRYSWSVDHIPVSKAANRERQLPRSWIDRSGFGITARARNYLLPLIQGEDYPPYRQGLPNYARLKLRQIRKKLPPWPG